MRLTCMVCRELLVPSDDVNVAPCGHYLHYTCWIEWLERAKNCPQCRAKTTRKQLVKLFFNVADSEAGEQDTSTLSNKIDSLTFELRMKNKDIENLKELVQTANNKNTGLREEIIKYRDEADDAKSTSATLQEKIRYLQRQNKEVEDVKKECERLRVQNERLKGLETVVRGSTAEVTRMIEKTPCTPEAIRNLALFCGSLKSVLDESKKKRDQIRDLFYDARDECKKLKEENRLLKLELESSSINNQRLTDDLSHLEEERKSLSKKIVELEAAVLSPTATSVANKALKRLLSESPAPALKQTSDDINDSIISDENHTPVLTAPGRSYTLSQLPSSQPKESEDSPLFGIKPKVVKANTLKRPAGVSNISIFSHRLASSKVPQPKNTSVYSEGYDGLGGHSKADDFPVPVQGPAKKLKPSPSVVKKKLSAPAGVPKLTQFDGFLDFN